MAFSGSASFCRTREYEKGKEDFPDNSLVYLQLPSSYHHPPHRLIRNTIISRNLPQWLPVLLNTPQHSRPFARRNLPLWIVRTRTALRKRRKIRLICDVNCRMPIHEDIISARKKLFKRDKSKVRPVARCPSVPVELFYIK
jgi:hypothetical protein